jgi:hypothetical protein
MDVIPVQLSKTKASDKYLINMLRYLLTEVENTRGSKNKAKIAYRLFDWISRNIWFLEEHESFLLAIKDKLEEFKNEPATWEIINDFVWMQNLKIPLKHYYTRRGRKIIKPTFYSNT